MHDVEVMRFCVRAWLRHVRGLAARVEELSSSLEAERSRLELVAAQYREGASPAADADALPDGVARLEELCRERAQAIAECAAELAEAERLCPPTLPARRAVLLHDRDRMTWPQVGRVIGYSERSTFMLAENGYRQLYYAMPERWRRDPIPNAMPR